MYNINSDYKNACKQLTRQSRTKVVIDGVTYDGSKYIKDYPKFSHNSETMIGGFPIKSAEFSLWIKDNSIDIIDKEIKIYRGLLVDEEIIWIPQGVFYAQGEDVTTSDTGEYISIKCYDKAKDAGTKTYIDNNTYPISETNYIKNVINQAGYELDENVFVESNYMMTQKPNMNPDTSVREIVSRYAEQRGAIALFSRLGKVQIKRPTEIDFLYKFYEYKKFTCESVYGPLNQIILGNKNINNNVIWPTGEKAYPWTINDNPFLDLFKLDRNQEIYNQIKGLKMIPFSLTSALDVFYLDINDVIKIEKKDKSIQMVTILALETENRLKCKISASVQNKSGIDYGLAGSLKKDLESVRFDVDYNKNEINALVTKTNKNTEKIDFLNPIDSVSGNPIFLQNSAGKDIPKLVIKGNSVQEFDTRKAKIINGYFSDKIVGNSANRILYIPIQNNETYTVTKKTGTVFSLGLTNELPANGVILYNRVTNHTGSELSIANSNYSYLAVYYWSSTDEITEQEMLNSIKIKPFNSNPDYPSYIRPIIGEKEGLSYFFRIKVSQNSEEIEYNVDLNQYDEENHIINHYELAKVGSQYDELEVASGNFIKRIGKIELDGAEPWVRYNNTFYCNVNFDYLKKNELTTMCTHYESVINVNGGAQAYERGNNTISLYFFQDLKRIYVRDDRFTNEADFISFLQGQYSVGTPVTLYYQLAEEEQINLKPTKVKTFEDDCYVRIDDELIDFFDCDYYTKSKITEYFETQKDSEAKMQILNDSITQKVSEVTTTVKNNEMAVNEKLNDFATNESVEQQISSVENKITSSEQKITIINEQLENGISQVRTEKGYTFNNQGLIIDDSNSKVQNKLAETGMTIIDKSSNTTLLFAGYDTSSQETIVKAKNMTVEKYLVAPNCRIEEYNNPIHGKGTGVFSL